MALPVATSSLALPVCRNKYSYPPTKEDWRRIKPFFVRLYLDEEKTLKDLMKELQDKHSFKATTKMCKSKITEWHLERNLRQHEVEHILGLHSQRRAQQKDTVFILREKTVDMENIYRYVRRKGMSISHLVARYRHGQSKACPGLIVLSPQATQPCLAPLTPEGSLEPFLREARDMQLGMLDAGLCKAEDDGITFRWTRVSSELSDLWNNDGWQVLSKMLDVTLIRRLALLLESAVEDYSTVTFLRIVKMVACIVRAGYDEIAQSILNQLHSLINLKLKTPCPQFRFLAHLTRLQPRQLLDAYLGLLRVDTNMHVEMRPGAARFYISSQLDEAIMRIYFGLNIEISSLQKLLREQVELFGLLHEISLDFLAWTLHADPEAQHEPLIRSYIDYLSPEHLLCKHDPGGLVCREKDLSWRQVRELTGVYLHAHQREAAAWLSEKLVQCRDWYAISPGEEYQMLRRLEYMSDITSPEKAEIWSARKLEIEDTWRNEVEAAVPDQDLAAACGIVTQAS